MKKVKGIGGIFFKVKKPEQLKQWYRQHLGLEIDEWGTSFKWRDYEDPNKVGRTELGFFHPKTNYFEPSQKEFMINFQVENLEELVETLKKEGIEIIEGIEEYDYGKFAWIMDIEGNKIELWEPKNE